MMLLLLFMIVGCSSQSSSSGSNGEIVIGIVSEPDSVDVHKTSSMGDANVPLYQTLLQFDYDGNLIPGLVEEYSVADDGHSVTFQLKEGMKFHSGEPVNAEAVKKSMERLIEKSPFNTNIGSVETIEVLDEYSLKIVWTDPFAPFFTNMASPYLAPIDVTVLDEDGEGFEKNPSASGPLKLVDIKRGDSLVYEPYENYPDWQDGGPGFSKVTFRFIPDDETRILEFKRGGINVLLDVPFQYIEELEEDSEVELIRIPNYVLSYLGWNNKLPIFQDVNVRKAIALAIDRDTIINTTFNGEATAVYGPLPKATYGYSEKIETKAQEMFARNIDEAKKLLEAAGWTEGSDGIRTKDGERFSVELWVDSDPANQRAGQIIQNQLKEIGIEINLSVKESAAIIEMTPKGAHEMILWSFGWLDADVLNFLLFGEGKSTRLHFEKEEIYSILEKAAVEMDTEKRLALYEEAQELLLEESPWVPLYVKNSINAVRGFDSFEMHPIRNNIVWPTVKISE